MYLGYIYDTKYCASSNDNETTNVAEMMTNGNDGDGDNDDDFGDCQG